MGSGAVVKVGIQTLRRLHRVLGGNTATTYGGVRLSLERPGVAGISGHYRRPGKTPPAGYGKRRMDTSTTLGVKVVILLDADMTLHGGDFYSPDKDMSE